MRFSAQEQVERLQFGTVDFINPVDLQKKIEKGLPLRVKIGADPTKADLHVGHTVVLNKVRQFQEFGHHVDFLIGDFTAMIGDPTGKNETRPHLSQEQIVENTKTYSDQVFKVLDRDKTNIVYNSDWFSRFEASDFIKLSAQYTVARMLERDDFSERFKMGTSIGIHEFLYPLCQGYDSVYLKSDVELGGTDQKFNLLVGRELQKSYGQKDVQCVITLPILEGLDGVNKMSKSLNNYISIIDSPKEMFGKTMRISDDLMLRWLELLTDITSVDLSRLRQDLMQNRKHPRDVKVGLAKFLVTRFHSALAAHQAEEEFQRMFVEKGLPDELPEAIVAAGTMGLCQLMIQLGLATSRGEARRLIEGRAVELDQIKVEDTQLKLELKSGSSFVFKVGKRKFMRVIVQ